MVRAARPRRAPGRGRAATPPPARVTHPVPGSGDLGTVTVPGPERRGCAVDRGAGRGVDRGADRARLLDPS
ncbi:hypothetical protein FTX61_13125 [Nitriliruptoraceae bacterium ZYF776]|nr:hypothetical protein [Profundirhabdus halotolerans]